MSIAPLTPQSGTRRAETAKSGRSPRSAIGAALIAPDLLAELLSSAARSASSDVVEAQCTGDGSGVFDALSKGLGDPLAKLLASENGETWGSLYFRAFAVFLHRHENMTAIDHISLEALMAFISNRFEHDSVIPEGSHERLVKAIFGQSQ